MKSTLKKLGYVIGLFFMFTNLTFAKIKVGITLLPYYSYVKNVVEDKMEVVSVIPPNVNVHTYAPNANDIKKLSELDVIVINGIGHDEFVKPMIEIAKKNNKNLKVINANSKTTTMITAGQKKKGVKNPHTFISVTQSIQQIDYITAELSKLDPENKAYYISNAQKYIRKLREIKNKELSKVKGKTKGIKVATTHGGYDYLLGEFGITVSAVVEPAHAQNPNSADLKETIDKIKKENIQILFDESDMNNKNANLIKKETGIKIAYLSHITKGELKKDAFEKFIKTNLENISSAILSVK